MDYETFTKKLSERLNVNKQVFDIDLEDEVESSLSSLKYPLIRYSDHELGGYPIKKYHYSMRADGESWECVSLHISVNTKPEIIELVNEILPEGMDLEENRSDGAFLASFDEVGISILESESETTLNITRPLSEKNRLSENR